MLGKFDYGNEMLIWNGISGFIELNENTIDAVFREIKEEIGIEIDESSLEYKGNRKISDEFELEIFIAHNWNGDPEPKEKSLKKLQWFLIDELPFGEMFPGNEEWLLNFLK